MSDCKKGDCGNCGNCGADTETSQEVAIPWSGASRAAPLTHLFHEECAWLLMFGLNTNNEKIRNLLRGVYMSGAYSALTTAVNGIEGTTTKDKSFTMAVSIDSLIEEAANVLEARLADEAEVMSGGNSRSDAEEDDLEEAVEDADIFTLPVSMKVRTAKPKAKAKAKAKAKR